MNKNRKRIKFIDYEEELSHLLQNPDEAIGYLNAALLDDDPRVFLLAVKDVLQAHGENMASIAEQAQLNRENLYRMLSKKGNPKLTSIRSVLNTIGFQLAVQPYKK